MSANLRFDESLPAFVDFLFDCVAVNVLIENLFLRDASGRLTFVVSDGTLTAEQRREFSLEAASKLAPYVDGDGFAIATSDELFDATLADASVGWRQRVQTSHFSGFVRLLDRRVVGADWLRAPTPLRSPPRLVFSSLKGGVGRSTALCVCAAALAHAGKRVLTVDMDVEAPGLGTMLLTESTTPKFGLLDYFVESNFSKLGEEYLRHLVSPSWLAAGLGVVDVIPALGLSSAAAPQNVISKIARAYIDATGTESISTRLQKLLDDFSATGNYDVILLDARAGLHETTGAAILGAGGRVFLFGGDQPQTLAAFEFLFANLALLGEQDWSDRLTIVHAKASLSSSDRTGEFARKVRERLGRWFHPVADSPSVDLEALRDVFEVQWSDEEAAAKAANSVIEEVEELESFKVVPIFESDLFRDFDPLLTPDRLTAPVYSAIFGEFVASVVAIVSDNQAGSIDE